VVQVVQRCDRSEKGWAAAIMALVKGGSTTLGAFGLNYCWGPFVPAILVVRVGVALTPFTGSDGRIHLAYELIVTGLSGARV
jgi:hypothetical protein